MPDHPNDLCGGNQYYPSTFSIKILRKVYANQKKYDIV